MIIKVYLEYKIDEKSICPYKKNLGIIHSFYDSNGINDHAIYRSLDESNRFVEEFYVTDKTLSVEQIKIKRKELQDQLKDKINIRDFHIFTFRLVERY